MRKSDRGVAAAGAALLMAALCPPWPGPSLAGTIPLQIPAGLDTSDWKCEYCAFETGTNGELGAGVGYVSDSSFKFGEYNGLEDQGAWLIANGTARYRGDDASYLDIDVRDLGLDTRFIDVEGGRQGRYRAWLTYDGIPHNISDSAQTPYLGSGGDVLTLPGDWVYAGSTAGMTELDNSLRNVNLQTRRDRFGIGFQFIPASRWDTSVNFRHEVRDGQISGAGTFYFNAAQLAQPIDYVTDELQASVSYSTRKWQARLDYYGSFFNDRDESLIWQNAYNPLVAGADEGQLALPPDNQSQQLVLSSGYQVSGRTRVSGDIAVGRMKQNESLLPTSINPNLVLPLPRNTAEAEVDTVIAGVRVDSAVTDRLRVNAAYRYNDRNNQTPSAVFDWVTTDVSVAPPRSNLPYSFTDQTGNLAADYRITASIRVRAGYDYQRRKRTYQEVNHTDEGTVWAKLRLRAGGVDIELSAAHADRDISNYDPVPEIEPPENPLMRKFNLADRRRDTGGVRASFSPHERVTLGLGVSLSRDQYSHSVLGLTGSREEQYNADASVALSDKTTLNAFAARQRIKSTLAGSQAYSTPDWWGTNNDTFNTLGVGVKHGLIKDRVEIGADYARSRSTGKVVVETGAPGSAFPDLRTQLDTFSLYADYRLQDNLSLHATYWLEGYSSHDWMLDGVTPATIPNVIAFGADSPGYHVNVLMTSVRYRF